MSQYITVLKKYATFSGRSTRSEYWYFILFNTIITMVFGVLGGLFQFPYLSIVYSLITLIPAWAVSIRRAHDSGKSGWFTLIPIYNFILMVLEGTEEENRFGPNPRALL